MREGNECVCLVFRVAWVRAVRCIVGVSPTLVSTVGTSWLSVFMLSSDHPVLLSPAPCFKSIVQFSLVVPPSVFCSITHYSGYPITHIPYSIDSNSIMPVVRAVPVFQTLARGTISISGSGGKYMCFGYCRYPRGENCKCSLLFRKPCIRIR